MSVGSVPVAVTVQEIAAHPSVEDIGLPSAAQLVISFAPTNAIVPIEGVDSIVTRSSDYHIRTIGSPENVGTVRSDHGCLLPVAFLRGFLGRRGRNDDRDDQRPEDKGRGPSGSETIRL